MKPWKHLDSAEAGDTRLELWQRGDELAIRMGGEPWFVREEGAGS